MTPGLTEEQLLAKKHYTPLGWFIAGALAARADPHWRRLPVCVLSDGREPELAALLRVPNCHLVTRGTAIGDLLFLAKAKLLFGTGHSTFSMWASHLGAMPTVYAAGKLDQRVFAPEDGVSEGEWAPGQPLPPPPGPVDALQRETTEETYLKARHLRLSGPDQTKISVQWKNCAGFSRLSKIP